MKFKKCGLSSKLSTALFTAGLILIFAVSGCATIDYDMAGASERFDWREVLDGC